MRAALDAPSKRAAEDRRLFATACVDATAPYAWSAFDSACLRSTRTRSEVRRPRTGLLPFSDIQLTTVDDELWCETGVDDIPDAVAMLAEFVQLLITHRNHQHKAEDMIQHGLIAVAPNRR